jgi:hypothetical protein
VLGQLLPPVALERDGGCSTSSHHYHTCKWATGAGGCVCAVGVVGGFLNCRNRPGCGEIVVVCRRWSGSGCHGWLCVCVGFVTQWWFVVVVTNDLGGHKQFW